MLHNTYNKTIPRSNFRKLIFLFIMYVIKKAIITERQHQVMDSFNIPDVQKTKVGKYRNEMIAGIFADGSNRIILMVRNAEPIKLSNEK